MEKYPQVRFNKQIKIYPESNHFSPPPPRLHCSTLHHLSPEFLLHPHPLLSPRSSQSHPVTTSLFCSKLCNGLHSKNTGSRQWPPGPYKPHLPPISKLTSLHLSHSQTPTPTSVMLFQQARNSPISGPCTPRQPALEHSSPQLHMACSFTSLHLILKVTFPGGPTLITL